MVGKRKSIRLVVMFEHLKPYNIILASNSPRRRELLAGLGLDFSVNVLPNIDESYPPTLPSDNVAEHIACKKAEAYKAVMHPDDLIITADTVVIVDNRILGKPHNASADHRNCRTRRGMWWMQMLQPWNTAAPDCSPQPALQRCSHLPASD